MTDERERCLRNLRLWLKLLAFQNPLQMHWASRASGPSSPIVSRSFLTLKMRKTERERERERERLAKRTFINVANDMVNHKSENGNQIRQLRRRNFVQCKGSFEHRKVDVSLSACVVSRPFPRTENNKKTIHSKAKSKAFGRSCVSCKDLKMRRRHWTCQFRVGDKSFFSSFLLRF